MRLISLTGAEYSLDRAETTIGRSTTNTIVVSDPRVSGYHAVIRRDGDAFILSDPGSTNGTFVNGSRVTSPQRLQIGDTITLGGTSFTVVSDEDYARTDPLPNTSTVVDLPPSPAAYGTGWQTPASPPAPSPASDRYYHAEVQPVRRQTVDPALAILLEILPGLFLNLLGIGWIIAGNAGTGITLMVLDLFFLCLQIGLALFTAGISLLCTMPLQLMFVILSTVRLNKYLNRVEYTV